MGDYIFRVVNKLHNHIHNIYMSFYKEILPFIDYIYSIRKLKNYFSFDMVFPEKWSLPKNLIDDGQILSFNTDVADHKGISFVTEISDVPVNDVLNKISKIIKLNKEKEFKEKLFRDTVEKLKQTFEKTDLEKLKNLYFDFELDKEINLEINNSNGTEGNVDKLVGEREEKGLNGVRKTKKTIAATN